MAAPTDVTATVFFSVEIDNHNLGNFVSCSGLSFEVKVEKREEGGNPDFVHQLVGGINYSNVKFTRPFNADSAKIASWFSSLGPDVKRATGKITALTPDGKEITTWSLKDVIPVKWSGPDFSAESPKAAIETLEIAHHGFLQ